MIISDVHTGEFIAKKIIYDWADKSLKQRILVPTTTERYSHINSFPFVYTFISFQIGNMRYKLEFVNFCFEGITEA